MVPLTEPVPLPLTEPLPMPLPLPLHLETPSASDWQALHLL